MSEENNTNPAQPLEGASSVMNVGDVQTPDWRSSLPEEYRDKHTDMRTPADFVKGYDNLVRKLGDNPLVRPKEDASQEDKDKFNSELRKLYGVPDNADAYVAKVGDDAPQEIKEMLTEERLAPYKEAALKAGVTPEGFEAMVGVYQNQLIQDANSFNETSQKTYEETVSALKKEWGDDYEKNTSMGNEMLKRHVPESEREHIVQKYGNDPVLIKAFANLAKKSSEVFSGESTADMGASEDGMRAEYTELISKSINDKLSIEERRQATKKATELGRKLESLKKG